MTTTIETDKIQNLRFPIGMFEFGKTYTGEDIEKFIKKIDEFPAKLKKSVTGLTKEQLDTTYREGGWTIRQVIHHLADSHMNAYIRFRLALTEDTPAIKPYDQQAWAELEDAKNALPEVSLNLLTSLHKRWAILLKSMTPEDFDCLFYHPEHQMSHGLKEILAMYVWHGDHHYAHIQQAKALKSIAKPKAKKTVGTKKAVSKQTSKQNVKKESAK